MKDLYVTLYPFATQTGTISVPNDLSPEDYSSYVTEHFDDININEDSLSLDYCGTDIEIEEA